MDVKGAFDNVGHDMILFHLSAYNCGERIHNYVIDFLTDRTATVGMGDLRSDKFNVPIKGTPQGSVISSTQFNLAISSLPKKLKCIEGIGHALYADDLTLWTTGGSAGQQVDALQ